MISSNGLKVLGVVAAVLGAILVVVAYQMKKTEDANRQQAQAPSLRAEAEPEVPKLLAVVAAKPLGAYRKITKDDVQLVEVTIAPKSYYTNIDEVIGKEPLTDIDVGAPITERYFGQGNVLAKAIPPGHQAISVTVSDVIGVGGFVRPGDIVDVLLYLRGGGDVERVQARVLLRDTRVLAYEELLVERPEGLKDEEQTKKRSSSRRQRTAVLAVPQDLTTRLMLGANMGELRLALHGVIPEGTQVVELPPALQTEGGLPVDEKVAKAEAAKKVPDKVITARQLARLPASQKKPAKPKVYVYRGSDVQAVSP